MVDPTTASGGHDIRLVPVVDSARGSGPWRQIRAKELAAADLASSGGGSPDGLDGPVDRLGGPI